MAERHPNEPRQQRAAKPELTRQELAVVKEPRIPFIALAEERFGELGVDRTSWKALVEAIWPEAETADSVVMALAYCKARRLDPFKKPVHIVPVWSRKLNRLVETVWPGIAEQRTTAMRTGQYGGCDATVFGPEIERDLSGVKVTFPEWAQHTLYKIVQGVRCPVVGPKVMWMETYATAKHDTAAPNAQWKKRPLGQLEKCFSPETEVLTTRGFERFDSVTGRIVQVADDGLVATDAAPFRRDWSGPMVEAKGAGLNFCVTPNHDMVTTDGKIEAEALFREATSVPKRRIPAGHSGDRPDAPISDRAIYLAAAYLCDGYDRTATIFAIAVSRSRKVDALDAIGGWRSRKSRSDAGATAQIGARTITTTADKTVYTWPFAEIDMLVGPNGQVRPDVLLRLSPRQAALFVSTMVFFDGSIAPNGTSRFYASRLEVMAAFELAACAAGLSVSDRSVRNSDGADPNYFVTLGRKASFPVLRHSESQRNRGDSGGLEWIERNASGEVWCCTVPSGTIIVRRGGFAMLCGNCAEAQALRRGFPEELGDERTAEEMEGQVLDAEVIEQARSRYGKGLDPNMPAQGAPHAAEPGNADREAGAAGAGPAAPQDAPQQASEGGEVHDAEFEPVRGEEAGPGRADEGERSGPPSQAMPEMGSKSPPSSDDSPNEPGPAKGPDSLMSEAFRGASQAVLAATTWAQVKMYWTKLHQADDWRGAQAEARRMFRSLVWNKAAEMEPRIDPITDVHLFALWLEFGAESVEQIDALWRQFLRNGYTTAKDNEKKEIGELMKRIRTSLTEAAPA